MKLPEDLIPQVPPHGEGVKPHRVLLIFRRVMRLPKGCLLQEDLSPLLQALLHGERVRSPRFLRFSNKMTQHRRSLLLKETMPPGVPHHTKGWRSHQMFHPAEEVSSLRVLPQGEGANLIRMLHPKEKPTFHNKERQQSEPYPLKLSWNLIENTPSVLARLK